MVNKQKHGHGGFRPGAGRPKGALNRRTVASNQAAASLPRFDDPLAFLQAIMGHPGIVMRVRISAAKTLLPYVTQ